MAFRLTITKDPTGNVGMQIEGQANKDEVLGCLAIVEDLVLHPPEQPKVLTAPEGALRHLNGGADRPR